VSERNKNLIFLWQFITLNWSIFGLVPENEGISCYFLTLQDSNFGIVDIENILPIHSFIADIYIVPL